MRGSGQSPSDQNIFRQFHVEYPQHEKNCILDETVKGLFKA